MILPPCKLNVSHQFSFFSPNKVEAKNSDDVDKAIDKAVDDSVPDYLPGGKVIKNIIKRWAGTVADALSPEGESHNSKKSSKDKKKKDKYIAVDFDTLLKLRSEMILNLSKATAFTASSEYKIQEVTGITNIGHHTEKGNIANSLQVYPDMNENYHFAELNSFVNEAGANKIIDILKEKAQQQDQDTRQKIIWAKDDRAKAKLYRDKAVKGASDLSKQVNKWMSKADSASKERLKTLKVESDDTIKLCKSLAVRNKDMDSVMKDYEKSNKIVTLLK